MNLKTKKIALLPNVITAFGLSCGLFVIFKMNMITPGEVNAEVLLRMTAILLMAALADLMDGAIARAMKAESEFGGIFDSLADAISFGVAPSVVVLKSLSAVPGTNLSFFIMLGGLIFSLCGVLRLVRFSLQTLHPKEEQQQMHNIHFTGLPIPAAAAAAISLNLFIFSDDFRSLFSLSFVEKSLVLSFSLILLGYCMISRWKFPSVKAFSMRVASFRTVCLTVLAAALIFYGIFHYFSLVFVVLCWSYVLIAWSIAIIRKLGGSKSAHLADFEPEPEEEEDS